MPLPPPLMLLLVCRFCLGLEFYILIIYVCVCVCVLKLFYFVRTKFEFESIADQQMELAEQSKTDSANNLWVNLLVAACRHISVSGGLTPPRPSLPVHEGNKCGKSTKHPNFAVLCFETVNLLLFCEAGNEWQNAIQQPLH
jgi:hypothetical protein